MLLIVPVLPAVVTMVSVGSERFRARPVVLAWSQTMSCPLGVQVQPVPEALTKVSAPRRSITRSGPVAVCGPSLRTLIVDVMFEPTFTGLGDLVLVSRRSAPSGRTFTVTEPLLLVLTGSALLAVMLAVLV